MQKHEITVRVRIGRPELERAINTWANLQNARVRPMGRLVREYKTEGDNMHWHIGGLKTGMGTVEVTYMPSAGVITVLVHENRRGNWAGKAYEKLVEEIMRKVSRSQV